MHDNWSMVAGYDVSGVRPSSGAASQNGWQVLEISGALSNRTFLRPRSLVFGVWSFSGPFL